MGIKEYVLALADELDGVSTKENCDACLAFGTELCCGDLECVESAHKACAKRLREIVEHDAGEVTTMSAYDLLPEEDRKAIAWVREQGGLDAVEKRLMPDGMEWPTVDGKPVVIGERMRSCGIDDCKVVGIDPANSRLTLASDNIEEGKATYFTDSAEYCHRPMPKVLDADGMEIRVGDDVWDMDGTRRKVRRLNEDGTVEFEGHEDRGWFVWKLTHRAPVLAADGEPLEVGQTVYGTRDLEPVEIVSLRSKEYDGVHTVKCKDRTGFVFYAPDDLTHQRPVLDADGVPIKVGDTVWDIETGCGRTVRAVNDNETVEFDGHENRGWFGRFLTHRAPVLAADGEPLREGEHVYHVETGAELVVKELPKPGEYQAVVVFALPTSPASHLTSFDPDRLTHERPVLDEDGVPIKKGDTVYVAPFDDPLTVRGFAAYGRVLMDYHSDDSFGYRPDDLTHAKPEPPDSWERIEEDATKNPFDYCKDVGHRLDTCENSEAYKARDIVRRARKLAERGEL